MALPPTVPTSFVPRPGAPVARRRSDFSGAFAFLGYGVLAVVVALGVGAFVYSNVLTTEQQQKDKELKAQIDAIDPQAVSKFVHLRDRLSRGLVLLDQHVTLTGFWEDLAAIVPQNVSFSSMHVTRDDSGRVSFEAVGIAKNFNTLAAASDAFAKDGRIKDAIFSGVKVEGNAVSFSLAATVDDALVHFTAPPAAAASPVSAAASTTAPAATTTTP